MILYTSSVHEHLIINEKYAILLARLFMYQKQIKANIYSSVSCSALTCLCLSSRFNNKIKEERPQIVRLGSPQCVYVYQDLIDIFVRLQSMRAFLYITNTVHSVCYLQSHTNTHYYSFTQNCVTTVNVTSEQGRYLYLYTYM